MKEICEALDKGGVDGLRQLLDTKPELATTPDRLGDLPLHVACSYRYETVEALHSLPVLTLLVERHPAALQTTNGHGMLPLHLSCWFAAEPQIRAIASWYPAGLAAADDNGYKPITFVIAKLVMEGRPWSDYESLLTCLLGMCPESLWNVDHQGVLALQSACFDNDGSDARPIPTGRQLLQLYCQLTCSTGGLHKIIDVEQQRAPLLVAIASQTRMEVAQMIFEQDPTTIRLTDKDGRLPLHHIMTNQFQSRQLRMLKEKLTWLLQVDPSAVFHHDHYGKTPLHCLLENQSLVVNEQDEPEVATTSLLLPSANNNNNNNADFLYSPDSTALLKLLLTPRNATSQSDRNEWILFAVEAVLHANHRHERSAPGLVQGLLQHYPGAILHANHKGQTALQLLLGSQQASSSNNENNNNSNCCSLDTIFTLVNHNPTSVL
ncbi:expressed unknown protein [Seminavis robusta]|uniref:Uncharacterized protein n=1 Tax=Seminavis robusta TaxID=568900 RepID=A0A9N8DGZ2_9STRA|nr:expressed unknown protein [Seminavis robusta]|eukprot:Sro85_g045540.1 n/a (435) ;mRNA; r:123527-124909